MAERAETVGAQKAQRDALTLFILAVLAGAFIALGAMFSTTVQSGAEGALPFGVARLLAGTTFCLGLILVVVGGAELFTGDALMVMAVAAGKLSLRALLRVWAIVYVGNLVGALGTAVLVFLSGQYLAGDGAVAAVALKIGAQKAALPFDRALFLGILCNVLVCLAVWLSIGARTTTDKVLAMLFPITAFVVAGFEHSVANMYFIPMAMLIKTFGPETLSAKLAIGSALYASLTFEGFLRNLVPVTIGNVIGGSGFVGAVYWFVYLRTRNVKAD
ncbi:MAG: formate/nitrite transporter family protein [Bradyrhizobiaceae bacterium]|nr:formate/nitrite transporter family protein [Bradyrhizobiaceae bacterium]